MKPTAAVGSTGKGVLRMTMIEWDAGEPFGPRLSKVCAFCRHWRSHEGRTCAAFPAQDSIPEDIWLARVDHQDPYPGDHGIHFEPKDYPYARSLVRTRSAVT